MPIRLIFAGHYRSGSTAIFEMMRRTLYKRNKNAIVLYEPLHPELPDKLKEWEIGKKDCLHGLNLWDDYFKLKDRELDDLLSLHPGKVVYDNIYEVKDYFDYLHSLPYDIYLQPNRTHFLTQDLRLRYRCTYLHTYRNPFVTWIDYLHPSVRTNRKAFEKASFDKNINEHTKYAFYLEDDYNFIAQRFNTDIASNNVQRFFVVWLFTNYFVYRNADAVVYFRSFVLSPKVIANRINTFLEMTLFDDESLSFLDVSKEIINRPYHSVIEQEFVKVIRKLNYEPFNRAYRFVITHRRWACFQTI